MDPRVASSWLTTAEFGQLVTVGPDGVPDVTAVPILHHATGNLTGDPDHRGGDLGSIVMHLARPNQQWRHTGPGLLVLVGPDAYVSPRDMPSARQATVVPTWNYRTVHIRGDLVSHPDPAWTRAAVDLLTVRHEPEGLFGEHDQAALDRMVRAIVGVELVITEVIGKDKLSQNKSSADITGVAQTLADSRATDPQVRLAEQQIAAAMEEISRPHAQRREAVVEQARQTRDR